MSHSYKHIPYCGDTRNKQLKHYANKVIRHLSYEENLQNNRYKRFFNSWQICDYSFVNISYEQYMEYLPNTFDKDSYQEYMRYYIRK